MSRDTFYKLNISTDLLNSDDAFRSYTGNVFKPVKKIVNVTYNNKTSQEILYIVAQEYNALLGNTWIRLLQINLQEIESQKKHISNKFLITSIYNIDDIISNHPEIFEKIVRYIPGVNVSFQFRENNRPIFHKKKEMCHIPFEKK
ncbi:hypothetical protein CDAR_382921 [Caerostris darwini]|uniref:Uncharacterized protein n=1 Tax=Caerostris darwini TaxID=1538125 RepID=A0AAV4UIN4_9ARAC|nr:hypothetical protein CDAR_382921 [Caerostris darwini]